MYENRQYLIISTSEINKIDFTQVCETSEDTLRKSVDETKTFIKWDKVPPSFLNELTNTQGPYSYEEILIILNSPEWTSQDEI